MEWLMPMTYLIFLATGSCFFSAHVGSELGRGLGFSGTAAEVIAARSHCKTWRRSGLQTLWLFSTDSGCSRLPLGRAAGMCLVHQSQPKVGRKKCKGPRGRGGLQSKGKEALQTIGFVWFWGAASPSLGCPGHGSPLQTLGLSSQHHQVLLQQEPWVAPAVNVLQGTSQALWLTQWRPTCILVYSYKPAIPLSTQSDVLQIIWSLWHPFLFYRIQSGLYSQPPVCEGLQASLTLNTLTELSSSKFQPVFCPSSAPKPGIFSVVGAWFCTEALSRRGAL